jgi:hypothetical protein
MAKRKLLGIRIAPDIVSDPDKFGETLDMILQSDPNLRRVQRQVVRRQKALRAAVSDEQWRQYMVIEEVFNDFHARAVAAVARAFYAAGRRLR